MFSNTSTIKYPYDFGHTVKYLIINFHFINEHFYLIAVEGSKDFKNNSKQRFKADFYHENARITKTRHHNSYGQQKILF